MAANPGDYGLAYHVGFLAERELSTRGFEVYVPKHATVGRHDEAFAPEAIISHRGALNRASIIVVPFGLPTTAPPSVEAALALEYAQDHHDVALLVAATDEAVTLEGTSEYFGLLGAQLTPPADINARIDGQPIVDAVCALVERAAAKQNNLGNPPSSI
jgi:hypothetical protein